LLLAYYSFEWVAFVLDSTSAFYSSTCEFVLLLLDVTGATTLAVVATGTVVGATVGATCSTTLVEGCSKFQFWKNSDFEICSANDRMLLRPADSPFFEDDF